MIIVAYVVACYCSRIPSYFIDWQKGLPPEGIQPHLLENIFVFILAPILTPLALFVETYLAFAWGSIEYERLLPLLTFIVVAVLSWIFIRKITKKETKELL